MEVMAFSYESANSTSELIEKRDFGYLKVLESNLLQITIDDDDKNLNPGESVIYGVTVRNAGNSPANVALFLDGLSGGWDGNIKSGVYLDAEVEESVAKRLSRFILKRRVQFT